MRQKGFTLIEVLVVLAVGSVILVGIVLSIHQVVWGTGRTNSQVVALTNVNYAALFIRKDIQMSQNTDLTDGVPRSSVGLTWTDYTGFEPEDERNHICTYALSDNGTELLRTYDGTVSIVGRYITSLGFTQNGRVVNVVITATGTGFLQRSKTLEFSVYMRTEGME